jgi:cell wall-associated NlpC family hydrolase
MHLKQKVLVVVLLLLLPILSACQSSSQQPDSKKHNCTDLELICQSHKGYPYVWGGETILEGGFDCSGFVYSVFKKMGKPIPRTTSKKYWLSFNLEPVNWKDSKCGSLVWWTIDRPYGHIGIMLDPPTFWQSGSSTGPISDEFYKNSYWDTYFVGTKKTNILE